MKHRKLGTVLVMLIFLMLVISGGRNLSISSKACAETKKEVHIGFPTKTISIIVPYAAGGGTDVVGRVLAEVMGQFLPEKVVVINKPGGAGMIGTKEVALSDPDGYTLLFQSQATLITQTYLTKGRVHYNLFVPLGVINADPYCLAVAKGAPWASFDEFIKDARNNPEKMRISHAGMGGGMHLSGVMLGKAAGVKLKMIPFPGSHPSHMAVLGGHVEATTTIFDDAFNLIKSGELRILAVATEKRLEEFHDVPTYKEKGVDLIMTCTRGLYAPKDVPETVLKILEETVTKVANSKIYTDLMRKVGHTPARIVGKAKMQEFFKQEDIQYKEALEVSGLMKE